MRAYPPPPSRPRSHRRLGRGHLRLLPRPPHRRSRRVPRRPDRHPGRDRAHAARCWASTARSPSSTRTSSPPSGAATSASPSQTRRPALGMVLEHLWPATAVLAAAALLLSTLVAVPLGVLSATHRGGWVDHASRLASLFLQSMPALLAGHHADPSVRGGARRAAARLWLGDLPPLDPARGDAGGGAARPERPPRPLRDARGARARTTCAPRAPRGWPSAA